MLTRSRAGFTLAEVMIALALTLVVAGTLYRLLVTTQRTTRAQAQRVELQSNLRAGSLIVLSELRELSAVPGASWGTERHPGCRILGVGLSRHARHRLHLRHAERHDHSDSSRELYRSTGPPGGRGRGPGVYRGPCSRGSRRHLAGHENRERGNQCLLSWSAGPRNHADAAGQSSRWPVSRPVRRFASRR